MKLFYSLILVMTLSGCGAAEYELLTQHSKGDAGETGNKGDVGQQGVQGAVGTTGARGIAGPQGLQGNKGDKGDSGANGHDGVAGTNGHDGSNGVKGERGNDGLNGHNGDCAPSDNDYDDNGTSKMFVCHRRGDGTFKTIKVGAAAYSKHVNTGSVSHPTNTHVGDTAGICFAGDDLRCY